MCGLLSWNALAGYLPIKTQHVIGWVKAEALQISFHQPEALRWMPPRMYIDQVLFMDPANLSIVVTDSLWTAQEQEISGWIVKDTPAMNIISDAARSRVAKGYQYIALNLGKIFARIDDTVVQSYSWDYHVTLAYLPQGHRLDNKQNILSGVLDRWLGLRHLPRKRPFELPQYKQIVLDEPDVEGTYTIDIKLSLIHI